MDPTSDHTDRTPITLLTLRAALGGTLMGLANLVPGISGGTMLLAAGVYPRFINAIGELTTLTFRKRSLITLATVVAAAVLAIALLAGPVKDLVVHHRWIMYSLFIGLTLGGLPVVWKLITKHDASVWTGAAIGFIGMALLALAQSAGVTTATDANDSWILMLLAGLAGASAMILPGVSGGYLLLVLGVYVPLLAAISDFVHALKDLDTNAILSIGLATILPVGLGVVVGIAAVSNLLRFLLKHYEKPTLGLLLGLLLGAVVGLYPFVAPVQPRIGDTLKGQTLIANPDAPEADASENLLFEKTGKPVEPDDWPTQSFTPSPLQVAASIGLISLGFGITVLIDRFGQDKPTPEAQT